MKKLFPPRYNADSCAARIKGDLSVREVSMEQENQILTKRWCVCLLSLVCCFLWGSAFPCVKIGYRLFQIDASDTASQLLFAGLRFSLAGVLAILFACREAKRLIAPQRSAWGRVLLLCLFQTVLQYIFFYIGMAHTSGVKGSIITASNTFIAILLSSLLLHQEQFTGRKILGCIAGFAGVVVINLTAGGLEGGLSLKGEGFVLLAAASYAASSVLIKQFSNRENPVVLSGYQFFVGGIVLILIGVLFGGALRPAAASAWILLLYMSLISSVAYSLWSLLLKYNPVSMVTVYGFSNPLFGVLLSMLLLKEAEPVDPLRCIAALLLVMAGICIVNLKGKDKPAAESVEAS